MAHPICIKLHNFKKFKVEHDGQLYELAATSSENLLSEFQKYKPEVKQLLVARPMVSDDFETLVEGSVIFSTTQSYISESQLEDFGEIQQNNSTLLSLEYKSPRNSGYSSQLVSYSGQDVQQKVRSGELSMIDTYCSHPSGFVEAVVEAGPIDTGDIARRVRDILEKYKISQTLFSKYVIRRSQGTTSDLLRTPKQWDRMSEEGRTPYRRMKAWLDGDLNHNIQMLVRIKQGHDIMSPTLITPKGLRTRFTDEQRQALEEFYAQDPRLTLETLQEFASEHNLTISAVRNWVNNRKQRMKRSHGSSFDDDDEMIPKKVDKHLSDDDSLKNDSPNTNDINTVDTSSKAIMTSNSIPTMVNTSLFNHSSNITDSIKTEQTSTNMFDNTMSKSEPDLEKYFPSHSNVWDKNNSS